MRQGYGVFTCHNETEIYSGEWLNDKRDGKGKLVVKKNEPSKKASKSTMLSSIMDDDYLTYDGEWMDDRKHGHGELVVNGCKYKGNWVADCREGHGTWTDCIGSYQGQWKNDNRHGPGIAVSITGTKYQGEWKEDAKVGRGVATFKTEEGKVLTELYTDGKMDVDDALFNFLVADLPTVKLLVK